MQTLDSVNATDRDGFVALLGGVFEHSPWVAQRAWQARPFRSLDALHQAMLQAVRSAPHEEQLSLVWAHPELAGREASDGTLTTASSGEQSRLGLTALSHDEFQRIAAINHAYREKFGFPCIVALRLHGNRHTVLAEMASRIDNDTRSEMNTAIAQIGHITRGRLENILGIT